MENKKDMVTGKIDGLEVTVEKNTTILLAAESAGIEIPHFCYHPGIGVEGSCRMCLVEIKGNPKLQISCDAPFTEGIEVITDSQKVKEAREGVLEFLLANHPLDCPICDKGGECPLQDYSFKYGKGKSRFEENKRKLTKHKVIGENIMFDAERCILCSRCVRFYKDVVGTHELVIKKRGHKAEIVSFEEKPLAPIFSGNLADICPVGALTTRDFRFQARPWEMKSRESVCALCSLNCSVQIWKDSNINKKNKQIRRFTPGYNPRVNGWWLCDEGRFGYKKLFDEKRILTTSLKEEDGVRELPFTEAILEMKEILSDLLTRSGRDSFKIVSTTDITNEEVWLLSEIAKTGERAGTVLFDISKKVHEYYKILKEHDLLTKDFNDIRESESLAFIGTDFLNTHPVLYLRVKELAKNGARIFGTKGFVFPDEKLVERVGESGDKKGTLSKLMNLLSKQKSVTLFVCGNFLEDEPQAIENLTLELKKNGLLKNVVIVMPKGHNYRGIFDADCASFGYAEEIEAMVENRSAKELLLIGDDVINKIFADEKFSSDDYNFICMIKSLKDEKMKSAHLVFPKRSFVEKDGTTTNLFGTLGRLQKAHTFLQEPLEEWKILLELALELGSKTDFSSLSEIYSAMASNVGGYPKDLYELKGAEKIYTHYNRELRK